jgi:protein SCO1/2
MTVDMDETSGKDKRGPGRPAFGLVLFIAVALSLGLLAGIYGGSLLSSGSPVLERATFLEQGKEVTDFSLINHTGNAFTRQDLSGRWSIMFFGFTHCPDICPTTLHSLGQVANNIEKSGFMGDTQVLFVSVDPARDTPEQLANYVPFFNPDFIGLTGTPDAIKDLTTDLGISVFQGPTDNNGGYSVDHSTAILIIDSEANLKAVSSPPHDVGSLTRDYISLRESL